MEISIKDLENGLLAHGRRMTAAAIRHERARIRQELKVEIFAVFEKLVSQAVPGDLHIIEGAILAALDRTVPDSEGKAWLAGEGKETTNG